MSITVKSLDVYGIKEDLRKRGEKKALQLIKAYEDALKRQQNLTALAISKIREISKQ